MQTDKRIYVITEIIGKENDVKLPILIKSKENIFDLINQLFPNTDTLKIETKLNKLIINETVQLTINRVVPIATELDLNMLL